VTPQGSDDGVEAAEQRGGGEQVGQQINAARAAGFMSFFAGYWVEWTL